MIPYERYKEELSKQYENINWIEDSGLSPEELKENLLITESELSSSPILAKAECFRVICTSARIAVDPHDLFQEKVFSDGFLANQRWRWEQKIVSDSLKEEQAEEQEADGEFCAWFAHTDFGHTSPNSMLLLRVGFAGLAERAAKMKDGEFRSACLSVVSSCVTAAKRLACAIRPYSGECADVLEKIASGRPETLREAMQLIVLYFFLHEYVFGTRVRTLGRLDQMLWPFCRADLEAGRITEEDAKEMLRYFLGKFSAAKVPFNLPLCIGGLDRRGNEVTNPFSYLFAEVFNGMEIISPKVHVRVSEKTPRDFLKLVLRGIRDKNGSYVFINDTVAVESLRRVGIAPSDALDYVPIGCYEPAVWGMEIGCTGNSGVNLAKAVEYVVTSGLDHRTGRRAAPECPPIGSYDTFLAAVKGYLSYMATRAMDYVRKLEKFYPVIGPDPLLSVQYDEAVRREKDVFDGGAKYENSSLSFYGLATLTDAVLAVKKLVFEEKKISFSGLCDALKKDWNGYEDLFLAARKLPCKYGNSIPEADLLAKELSEYASSLVNGQPNARGGVFKTGMFTIDTCYRLGKGTMATPDGRRAGDPLSKNLCATVGMDRGTVTALILSATVPDHACFPNGSVLDFVLHPTSVGGEEGLDVMLSLLMAYFGRGGFALHGNIFDASQLREAMECPEKYSNLQVRVCGWNAYFTNLTRAEQEAFIVQAEGAQ